MTQAQVDAINSGITKSIVDSRVIPSQLNPGYAENAVNADIATTAEAALIAGEAQHSETATSANTALSATYAPDYTPLSTFNETLGDLSSIIHEI